MTHVIAFVLGMATPWTVRVLVASAQQAREIWKAPEYYLDDPFNYDGLRWAGRVLVHAAVFFKGRKPPEQEEP